MASKPPRKMKYPPGARLADPIGFVLETLSPVKDAEGGKWITALKLRNTSAIGTLMQGNGTKAVLTDVVAAYNLSRALMLNGFGVDLFDIVLKAEESIRGLTERIQRTQSYTLYASEIAALKDLMELHDAQIDVATVGDIQKALERAKREWKSGNFTRISTTYIGSIK